MPTKINCIHSDINNKCNLLQPFWGFKRECLLLDINGKCEAEEKHDRPKPSQPPPNIPNKPTPPPAPPRKVSGKNPKEEFLDELLCLLLEFENKTGTSLLEISVHRVAEMGGSSLISGFGLKLK